MRLWSLHPSCLDQKGLVAAWREGLLARAVLADTTLGYRNHPQLERFKESSHPHLLVDSYLRPLAQEAERRGYSFDQSKLANSWCLPRPVTSGQVQYEWWHLLRKLKKRDPDLYARLKVRRPSLHPSFYLVVGPMESWERR